MTETGRRPRATTITKITKATTFSVMLVIFVAFVAATARLSAQAAVPAKFDSSRAYADLQKMVEMGPRPAGSRELETTRAYIRSELKKAGLTVQEQAFDADTPAGKVHMINLSTTVPGRATNKGRIVIGGHYDTKVFHEFRFVGASDAASSAAFVLEMARTLKSRQNELPVELLFLDGEEAVCKGWDDCNKPGNEDHTYGSRYYAQQAAKNDTAKDVKVFILVDMIGAKPLIVHRESYSTKWLTETVWSAAHKIGRTEFKDDTFPVEDDHLEFLKVNIPSVDIIDLNDYPEWHTAQDDLTHVGAGSLQAVGDVVLAALPAIEKQLLESR
jgi:glutaminyl-peptide cyclotransferase